MTDNDNLSRLEKHIAEQDRVLRMHKDAKVRVQDLVESLVGMRQVQGVTLAEVAAVMGDSVESVQSLEVWSGDPKLSTILRYAQAIGFTLTMTPRMLQAEEGL